MLSNAPQDPVSVSDYLETVNGELKGMSARVLGEVTDVQLYEGRSYLFFSVKDKEEDALLKCFMWKRDYALSGVALEPGMEVIISGYPNIHIPTGRLAFQAQSVELVGEGQLKKAYDLLKAKLEKEGVFAESRKRQLPELPQKIGLITSKDGAAIGDFQMNLGNYGYKVTLVDSRVEGQLAVQELLGSIRTLKTKDIEVLVLVRGGGSLESLLPFNNEALVREIVNFPVPVLVGVGHEKDISLIGLAADMMVSTPTATAQTLNESWVQATADVHLNQHKMISLFSNALSARQGDVQTSFQTMRDRLQSIFDNFANTENAFLRTVTTLKLRILELKRDFGTYPDSLARSMKGLISRTQAHLDAILQPVMSQMTNILNSAEQSILSVEKILKINDPERQLRLGYSIVTANTGVVRSISKLKKGQNVEVRVQDGVFKSDITEINKKV